MGRIAVWLVFMAVLAAGVVVRADDEHVTVRPGDAALFEGLIPGDSLSEEDLEDYYGRGVVLEFRLGSGTSIEDLQINNNGGSFTSNDVFNTTQINESHITSNTGILQNTPVIGDNNQVYISVEITLNINTVSIENSAGANIMLNQTLDLSGVISAFSN